MLPITFFFFSQTIPFLYKVQTNWRQYFLPWIWLFILMQELRVLSTRIPLTLNILGIVWVLLSLLGVFFSSLIRHQWNMYFISKLHLRFFCLSLSFCPFIKYSSLPYSYLYFVIFPFWCPLKSFLKLQLH